MQKQNYSRQREAIRGYLCRTASHPTAEEIYENIRRAYPNISLGTVYRNLGLLVEGGEALRIPAGGRDRFDGRTAPHYHFICDRCKRVFDIMPKKPAEDTDKESSEAAKKNLSEAADSTDNADQNPSDVFHGAYNMLNTLAAENFSGLIRGHNTVFYGICQACMRHAQE